MGNDEVDNILLRRSVRYFLETGAAIDLIGDFDALEFKIDGRVVSASQVILKAYAAGMIDAA